MNTKYYTPAKRDGDRRHGGYPVLTAEDALAAISDRDAQLRIYRDEFRKDLERKRDRMSRMHADITPAMKKAGELLKEYDELLAMNSEVMLLHRRREELRDEILETGNGSREKYTEYAQMETDIRLKTELLIQKLAGMVPEGVPEPAGTGTR